MAPTTNSILWKGNPVELEGPKLEVGGLAPAEFTVAANDLSPLSGGDLADQPRIILSVPSLDTGVCDLEVRRFNQEVAGLSGLRLLAISMDLPFAQRRWCAAAGVERVQTASDFRHRNFGTTYGVFAPKVGLLARAVFVIDGQNRLRHVEYVADATHEPDYAAALEAARRMV